MTEPTRKARPVTVLLHELPGLVTEVWLTRDAPNPSERAAIHTRSVPGSRPPLNLDVLDLMRTDDKGDLQLLHGWAVAIDELSEGSLAPIPPREPDWSTVCRYLAETWEWWRRQALCTDCEDEIRGVHARLSRLARVPQRPRERCPECGAPARRHDATIRCRDGHEVDVQAAKRAWLDAQVWTLAQCRKAANDHLNCPVSQKKVEKWVQRGQLVTVGYDNRGVALYRFADVSGLCDRWQRVGVFATL